MKPIADELGHSRAQLALAWAVRQPGISSVILGATRLAQLEENLAALEIDVDAGLRKKLDRVVPA